MKNKRKLSLAALLLAVLLFIPAFAVENADDGVMPIAETGEAAPVESTSAQQRVIDDAGLLDEYDLDELTQKSQELADTYGCGVAVVTVQDYLAAGYTGSAYDAAEQMFTDLHLGAGANGDGIILLLSMSQRDYGLFVHGAQAEAIFSDAVLQEMEENFLDDFSADDWYNGFSDYMHDCGRYLQNAADGGVVGQPLGAEPLSWGEAFVFALLVSCVIALIVCLILRMRMKSVHKNIEADRYVANGGLKLTQSRDIYRYTAQKRRHIPQNTNSGGGHSGGSVSHTSSGGHGRSGKF